MNPLNAATNNPASSIDTIGVSEGVLGVQKVKAFDKEMDRKQVDIDELNMLLGLDKMEPTIFKDEIPNSNKNGLQKPVDEEINKNYQAFNISKDRFSRDSQLSQNSL